MAWGEHIGMMSLSKATDLEAERAWLEYDPCQACKQHRISKVIGHRPALGRMNTSPPLIFLFFSQRPSEGGGCGNRSILRQAKLEGSGECFPRKIVKYMTP